MGVFPKSLFFDRILSMSTSIPESRVNSEAKYSGAKNQKLTVIIPCFNEKKTIKEIVGKIESLTIPSWTIEIVIVDDKSTDGTREILKNYENIHTIIYHDKNRGKGSSVKTGIIHATGDYLLIQDADLEYDPNDFQSVINPILEGKTKVTNGVRINNRLREGDRIKIGLLGWIGNHAITWTTNILYLNNAGEYEGCYKAFTKRLLDSVNVKTNDFDFDNELICKLLKRGHRIVDVPIHYYPRSYAQGKHINWRHGFKILWTIVKCRFTD